MSLETWRQLAAMYKVITKKKKYFFDRNSGALQQCLWWPKQKKTCFPKPYHSRSVGLWQVNILSEKNVKLQHKETWGFSLPVVLQKRTLSTFILLGWKQPWAAPLLILNYFSYTGINSGGSHQKHSGLAEHLTSLPLSKDECPLQRAHNMCVSHTWLWRYNTTLNYDHFSSQKIVNEKKSTGRDTWKKKNHLS